MTDYTPDEVLAGLAGSDENWEDHIYWDELLWAINRRTGAPGGIYIRDELVSVILVDEETGHEGSWDLQTYVVVQVGTQYFRKTGHYQSHIGDDWDGPFIEVTPVQKTVTVFEDKI
jgi:hypothetical protein